MAKATAFPCIKKKLNKKSYLVIRAPGTTQFKATTKVATVKDKTDATLTWDIHKQKLSTDRKAIAVVLHGKRTVARKPGDAKSGAPAVIDEPDSGTLAITLSDPPTGVDPLVVDTTVEYVDDFE